MSDKIAVVYIGPKEKKRDTVTGSRLIFPRHEPVEVDPVMAYQLLDFPTVFIRHEALAGLLAQQQAAKLAQEELEVARLAQAEREAQALSFVLNIGGDEVDLAKLTSIQLATLVEAEDLEVKQGAQEKVDDFRARVRDALQAKHVVNTEAEVE